MPEPIYIDCGPSRRGAHRLEAMNRCPQFYAYTKILNLQLGNRMPLERGSLGHVGLAHHYARLLCQQRKRDPNMYLSPAEAMRRYAQEHNLLTADFYPTVCKAVHEYATSGQWALLDPTQWTILFVEQELEIRLHGHLYTARIDLIVKDRHGEMYFVDHKFVSRLKGDTHLRYTLSTQFLGQQIIGQTLWPKEFTGCILNFVQVGDKNGIVYRRHMVDPAPAALARFPRSVAETEERIAQLSTRDPWDYPRANTELVCMHSYGICEAFEICQWGKSRVEAMQHRAEFVKNQLSLGLDTTPELPADPAAIVKSLGC